MTQGAPKQRASANSMILYGTIPYHSDYYTIGCSYSKSVDPPFLRLGPPPSRRLSRWSGGEPSKG